MIPLSPSIRKVKNYTDGQSIVFFKPGFPRTAAFARLVC